MNNKFWRHGDLSFHLIENNESGEILKHNGSFTLALGETTFHKHVITVPNIDDMIVQRTADGGLILTLKADGQISHEEHKTITIPKGTYRMKNEREYNYYELASQRVID